LPLLLLVAFLFIAKKTVPLQQLKQIIMQVATINKTDKKVIDWITPDSHAEVTLEDYRAEMQSAENSGFISLEEHRNNMTKWIAEKLTR
jgi:hypothetical protein